MVDRHQGDRKTRTLTCWDQMLMFLFCQLFGRQSLRDLVDGFRCHPAFVIGRCQSGPAGRYFSKDLLLPARESLLKHSPHKIPLKWFARLTPTRLI
jgi:hypothetical protein